MKALYRSEVAEQIGADACSSGCAGRSPPAPPAGASSSAPHGSRSPPCSSPTCSPRRATGSRWPTGSRAATRSSTTGSSPYAARPLAEAKLDGLREKAALRELAGRVLPATIAGRGKQPYRAPEVELFFAEDAPAWVDEALSPAALGEVGIWDPQRVEGLARRCRAGRATGMREGMALIGVLDPALASGVHWRPARRLRSRNDRAAGENRPHQSARPTTSEGGLMTAGDDGVRKEMRTFIEDNFLYMHPGTEPADGDDLLKLGIIDSLGFVELVEEVQSRYGSLPTTSRSPRRTSA